VHPCLVRLVLLQVVFSFRVVELIIRTLLYLKGCSREGDLRNLSSAMEVKF